MLVGAGSALLGAVIGGAMTYWAARESSKHQAEQERIAREIAHLEALSEVIAAITKHLAEVELSGAHIPVLDSASFPKARLLLDVYLPSAKADFEKLTESFNSLPRKPLGIGVDAHSAEEVRYFANEIDKKVIHRLRQLSGL